MTLVHLNIGYITPFKIYWDLHTFFPIYMFLYACWFIDKVTYAYRFPTSLSACIQVKKWTGKGLVFTKRLKDISNFVYALIEKKNGRKVLTRVFDFIQFIRSSGTIKVMLATNPIIVGRFSWYLALPPREHH